MSYSNIAVAFLLFAASASAFPRPNENVQIIESSSASQMPQSAEAAQIQQIPQIEAKSQPIQAVEPVYNPNLPIELNKEITEAQIAQIPEAQQDSLSIADEAPMISEAIQEMIQDVIQDAIEENAKPEASVGLEDIEQQFTQPESEQSNRQKRQFGLGALLGGLGGGYGKDLH